MERIVTQGEDVNAELTIKTPSGLALDMSGASRIYIALHDGSGNVKAKFLSGTASGGWYPIDTTNALTGILALKVLTEVTSVLKPGKHYWEVRIEYADGAYTDDSKYTVAKENVYAFTVKLSLLNKLILP